MKKIFILTLSMASFALVSTSCTKSGCPMQITQEIKFDKDMKVTETATALAFNEDCHN